MPDLHCNRCSFTTDDDEAAAEHARESGHLRCICCGRRSLTVTEALTCAQCVSRVRADLADVAQAYTLLEPATVDALTLLGDGTMQRLPRAEETLLGIRDEWPNDPLPVLPALASWEDMIREDYGDPKGPPGPTLTDVIGYLTRHLDTGHRIAQTFHAFDELAAEIRRHRSVVWHAAGLADDPVAAPARCFECGEQLLRTYSDAGLVDNWTCSGCRNVYTQHEYFFKLRVQQVDAPGEWKPLAVAAWLVDRSFATIQTWVGEGIVATQKAANGRLVAWMPDVQEASKERKRRNRSA